MTADAVPGEVRDDWLTNTLAIAEVELEAKERRQVVLAQQVAGLAETVKGLRRYLAVSS